MDDDRKAKHIDEIVKHFNSDGRMRTVKYIDIDEYNSGEPSEEFKVLCCDKCYIRDIKHDDSFWFMYGYCHDNFCLDYYGFVDEDFSDTICLKCVLNIGNDWKDNQYLNCQGFSKIFLEYTILQSLQIESLLKENKRLQAMVDYQPEGNGYLEAKGHFEGLLDKN